MPIADSDPRPERAGGAPAHDTDGALNDLLLRLLTAERDGDSIARLLDILTATTGLECAYLTRIDSVRNRQWIVTSRHAHQTGTVVPAGSVSAWDEALCKCALEDKTPATDEADELWPDNPFRVEHGVRTFVSQPVVDQWDTVRGTLCLASAASQPIAESALGLVQLFARIIGFRMDRDAVVGAAQRVFEDRCRQVLAAPLGGIEHPERVQREVRRVFHLP